MTLAVVTLSQEGAILADRLAQGLPDCRMYFHENVPGKWNGQRFHSVAQLTGEIFFVHRGLIYVAPCGIAVRSIAPHVTHKTQDPAVVVVDVGGRWAVSLLSGHEGGANDLAVAVANILSAEPVISTTTEALKTLIVGIGCRRGVPSARIIKAVKEVLSEHGLDLSQVRLLASADIKVDEQGLLTAAREIGAPLRFISSAELRECARDFQSSDFVKERVNIPAVAEPAALLAGRRTRLLVRKKIYDGVTVAVAQENCW
jgi:cobalt-precorrin 5A hydrolase